MLVITAYPDVRLRELCQPVTEAEFDEPELKDQVEKMIETMYGYGGIGLAANQVGFTNRVMILAESPELFPNCQPIAMINPVIKRKSNKKQTMKEGCLSFPGQSNYRRRARSIRLEYRDVDGVTKTWKAQGLAAQCIQHELDHLNGKTFLDK